MNIYSMNDKLESLIQEERKDAVREFAFRGVQDGWVMLDQAARELNMTVEEFLTDMVSEGYTIPKELPKQDG